MRTDRECDERVAIKKPDHGERKSNFILDACDLLICDGFGPLNQRETEARVSDRISGWNRLDQGYGSADQALMPGGGGGIRMLQRLINLKGERFHDAKLNRRWIEPSACAMKACA